MLDLARSRAALGAAAVATALLTGCAGHGTIPAASSFEPPQARFVLPDRKPPKCKGQQNSKQYASLTVTLSTDGGAFCIPEFGGFGGKVKYPPANPSVKLSLISSTTDYDGLPQLGEGTAIFYLQLAISGATSFGSGVAAGGGLTSKDIVPGDQYTVFGQAEVYGFKTNLPPCYTTATKGHYGGTIGGIGTLLEGVDIPAKASGFIEIYSGEQTSTQCSEEESGDGLGQDDSG
jgi:hypothetical protein